MRRTMLRLRGESVLSAFGEFDSVVNVLDEVTFVGVGWVLVDINEFVHITCSGFGHFRVIVVWDCFINVWSECESPWDANHGVGLPPVISEVVVMAFAWDIFVEVYGVEVHCEADLFLVGGAFDFESGFSGLGESG